MGEVDRTDVSCDGAPQRPALLLVPAVSYSTDR